MLDQLFVFVQEFVRADPMLAAGLLFGAIIVSGWFAVVRN